MKMKKRIVMAVAVAGSVMVLPTVAVQARRGADDPAGHVRQEDRRADRRVDDTTTTVAPTTTEGVVLSDTSSSNTTPTSTSTTTTQTGTVLGATTLEEAVAIAKKQFPTKTVEKVEKESEEGVSVWSVRFTDNSRVDVSVETGEVTRIKDKTNNSRSSREDDDSDDDKSGSDDDSDDKDNDDSDNSNDD
jgi:Peptidase propeptide and YPEB domain